MRGRVGRVSNLVIVFIIGGLCLACSGGLSSLTTSRQPIEQDRKPGWIYVVDSNNGREKAQVLLVDLKKGAVVRTFETGMNPDIAIAPDGKRLYVGFTSTDGKTNRDQLAIVDTSTGDVLHTVENPNRFSYNVYAASSAMSTDGRWLYVLKYEVNTIGPENASYWLETFDTQSHTFLPERATLGGCGLGWLSPSTKDREIQVVCARSKEVHLLKISDTGAATDSVVSLKSNAILAGGLSFDSQNLIVMRDGRIFKVDAYTRGATEVAVASMPTGAWVHSLVMGRNGSKIFLGINEPGVGRWAFREIEVLNTNDFSLSGSVKLSNAVDYLTLSHDGNQLYAIDSFDKSLTVIDAIGLKELKTIKDLGTTPSIAIEGP